MKEEISRQSIARERNWAKARIMGMVAGMIQRKYIFTQEEREIFQKIDHLKMELLDNWGKNSIKLGMKVKPRKQL